MKRAAEIASTSPEPIVRPFFILLLLLCATFEIACAWPAAATPRPATTIDWVRTVDGWERSSAWRLAPPPPGARLHPLLVAALELLAALFVLVAYAREPENDAPARR